MSPLKLFGAPRLLVNLAVLLGGCVGLGLQAALNLDNEHAFVLTLVICSLSVLVANMTWRLWLWRRA